MNWNKLKDILIVLLIVLNIFLFLNLQKTGFQNSRENPNMDDVINILQNRGIYLDCELPKTEQSVQFLHLGTAGVNKDSILRELLAYDKPYNEERIEFEKNNKKVVFIDEQSGQFYYVDQNEKSDIVVNVLYENSVVEYIMNYVKKIGINWDEYIVGNFSNNDKETIADVTITQSYKGNMIYDNYIHVVMSDTGLIYMEISNHKINGIESDDESELLRPYQVLLSFFTKEYSGTKIVSIDQGFKKISLSSEDTVEEAQVGLCWRVTTENESIYYVSLVNGQEIK